MITVTDQPDAADLAAIAQGLNAFNDSLVGPSERRALAATLRDDGGALVGGISGFTAWGWLYVQWLWLAERARGQGLVAEILAAAEGEALARGCHAAWIDSFNPQAIRAYQRAGYVEFGRLPDFPRGHVRVFLQKPLNGATP